ncbi:hypothetical protein [Robertmurraya kyonggiensis]|uniref:hypothetical protein n=1 Tax=Robertmurraya kyonggiensis TaxID=1037680 RepID=UPI00130EDB1D|nr:hypothetical protein [Robertmurraya kyonggiensis]
MKINDSDTSPVYVDTPPILQYGKYVIILIFIVLFLTMVIKFKIRANVRKFRTWEIFLAVFLLIIPMISFLFVKNPYLLQVGIFFSILVIFYLFPFSKINVNKINKYILLFILASIAVEIIQLFNFFAFERLPALGYHNSISVRFGSLWDDPNSFALIIPMLIVFVYVGKFNNLMKYLLIIALLFMLLLTQSLTGIATFIVSLPVVMFILFVFTKHEKFLKALKLNITIYVVCLFLFFIFVYPTEFIQKFLSLKQGSISGHLEGLDAFINTGLLDYIGLNPRGILAETGYINLLLNFGIFYLFAYVFIGLSSIYRIIYIIKNNVDKQGLELYYGLLFFLVAYLISLVNLPVEEIFPISLIYVLSIVLSYSKNSIEH